MSDSIGAILKEARRRRGLRVKDLAGQTNAAISPSYLSCIENDLRLPSEDLLLELADLLSLDSRQLYMQLVRQKAPAAIRDTLFGPATPVASSYEALRALSLEEIVEQAAQSVQARRDAQEARRELARLRRGLSAGEDSDAEVATRWRRDADRYRMLIEKTVQDMSITIDGDATILLHTIGLRPQPGKRPLVSLQHQVNLYNTSLAEKDSYFKLLEAPDDVPVEVQRLQQAHEQALIRVVFPDGLEYAEGCDRRVSYTLRSVLLGVYAMEAGEERAGDIFKDHRGPRGRFHILVDKPCEDLELVLRFPVYYIPEEVEAWAGTQMPADTDDNFIDTGVCGSWDLEAGVDYCVTLRVHQPLVGMRYGITWRPLGPDGFVAVKNKLGLEDEEGVGETKPNRGLRNRSRRRKNI